MDELDDITFSQSMRIIIDALMETVMEYFHITEQQLEEFTSRFVQRLFALSVDLFDAVSAILVTILDFAALLNHCDGIQSAVCF